MNWKTLNIIIGLLILFLSPSFGQSQAKLALLIGNGQYQEGNELKHPEQNCEKLTKTLEGLDFEVTQAINLDLESLNKVIAEFTYKAETATLSHKDLTLFIYYSGHTVHIDNKNYIIPIDFHTTQRSEVSTHCLDIAMLFKNFKRFQNTSTSTIFAFDGGRRNELVRQLRDYSDGIYVKISSVISDVKFEFVNGVYLTSTSTDLSADNNLFTNCLLKSLLIKDLMIEDIIKMTSKAVFKASDGEQMPYNLNTMLRDLTLNDNNLDGEIAMNSGKKGGNEEEINEAKVGEEEAITEMILIKGGRFFMGSSAIKDKASKDFSDEQPRHKERVKDFYIDQFEVTKGEFKKFVEATDFETSLENGGKISLKKQGTRKFYTGYNWETLVINQTDNHAVVGVSWYDAIHYCNWRSVKDGLNPCYSILDGSVIWNKEANGYRLPTETEWEYAAGGGKRKRTQFVGTKKEDEVDDYAHFNSEEGATMVGKHKKNKLGIYDLNGNVWEWCWDIYDEKAYRNKSKEEDKNKVYENPFYIFRVIRGGGWDSKLVELRVTYRGNFQSTFASDNIGFRCVRNKE